MKTLAASMLCLMAFAAFSQKAPARFGDIPIEDLKMKVYPQDSSADAVILVDYGVSTIEYLPAGSRINFQRLLRIKILNKNGFGWANFEARVYRDGGTAETITNIKAITYNLENGKVTESKADKDAIVREKHDDHHDAVKVAFSNVKVGSVLELSYGLYSDFFMGFTDWNFQTTIPTRWSEYRANIPDVFVYEKYLQGYVPLEINEQTQEIKTVNLGQSQYVETRYRWAAKNVPAFKAEPYMTTFEDYVSRLNFELAFVRYPNKPEQPMLGSWTEINKTYHDLLWKEFKGNNFLTATVDRVLAGISNPEDKLAAILRFVKNSVTWDETNRIYSTESLKDILETKKGNSAEINMILGSMIEKAGITVNPVLVSTRDHGMIREATPNASQFNYFICLATIDGKEFLLDATEKMLPTNLIPERCLNGHGLVLSEGQYKWINLETKLKTRTTSTAEFTLSPENKLIGKLIIDNSLYAALAKRQSYFRNGEQEYLKDFLAGRSWENEKSEILNADQVQNNFVETHFLTISDNITSAGDIVFLDPFVFAGTKRNPFKTEKREYPVDFGKPTEETLMVKLMVPENLQVEEFPKSKMLTLPQNGGKFLFNSSLNGNTLMITSILSINKSLFTQEEYPYLREFYSQVIEKQSEQIVLKKK